MKPEERDRLTRVETKQDDIIARLERMEKSVSEMRMTFAKMGGVGLALTAIGTAVGWGLSQIKSFVGLFQ